MSLKRIKYQSHGKIDTSDERILELEEKVEKLLDMVSK
jgi:hypothetical protein